MDRFDDPKNYRQKRESFTRSLQHFHETRGTPFRKIPQFCGKEVDLFRLYNVVTQRGGWVKVNRTNQWNEILPEVNIPKGCVNGGNALKQIYLRYLDRYEKVHYLGESGDRHDIDEEEEPRHGRRWSTRVAVHSVPLTYNHHQHNVVDNVRRANGLSTDIYKPSDYDRLALSLVSPLPNEQDFAINVCTLLSNEGKHTLKLDKCPRLVDFLLAHAGVYNHANLRNLFEVVYGEIRGHSFSSFWSDVLENSDLLDLTDETNFDRKLSKRFRVFKCSRARTNETSNDSVHEEIETNSVQNTDTCKTINSSDVKSSETKENNAVAETRTIEPCESLTNSIQESLKTETPNCNKDSCSEATNDDMNRKNDEEAVVNTESSQPCNLNGLSVIDVVESDTAKDQTEPVVQSNLNSDNPSIEVQKPISDPVESVESTLPNVNLSESESSKPSETPCEEKQSDEVTQPQESSSTEEVQTSVVSDSHETEEEKTEKENVVVKTPEEIALEEARLLEEKKRLEEEERLLKEEMEKKRIEEERIRAIEEAKKLEKQLREAEIYEAMLKQEEKKNKVVYWEENVSKRPKSSRGNQLKIEPEDLELFSLGRDNGTREYIGQRVLQAKYELRLLCEHLEQLNLYFSPSRAYLFYSKAPIDDYLPYTLYFSLLIHLNQNDKTNLVKIVTVKFLYKIAHILRNLTFCEESVQILAKNTTFMRFLLLCVNAKWSSLHQLGLDMLGNVSSELTLEDPSVDRIYQVFFCTVHRGIQHSNRFFIISCLEILNKVCQKDENEDVVCRNLDQSVYDQVCRLLSLHDIMILLYTLECLYSMSSMGEKACNCICRSKGAIEMLLALITVEAQSYGPKACILMRVIETVSGTAPSNPAPSPSPVAGTPNTVSSIPANIGQPCPPTPISSIATASNMTVQTAGIQKIMSPNMMRAPSPKTIVGMPMAAVATPVQVNASTVPPLVSTLPSVQQQHAIQQTIQENEQFALAWLRATFELSAGGKVEQQDLYRRYVESCSKIGRKGVIASGHFPRFVRSVFGGTVGPKSQPIPASEVKPNGPTTQSYYEGIKVRDVPLTINIKLVPVTEVPRPVMKKRPQVSTPKPPKGKRKKLEPPTSPILKAQLISPNKSSSPSPTPMHPLVESKVQVSTQTSPGQIILGQSLSPPGTPPPMDNSTLIKSLLASKVSEICMTAPLGMLSDNPQVTQRQQQQQKFMQQQQIQVKPETPTKAKVIRLNGMLQEAPVSSAENHLVSAVTKGKKEPPQPPPIGSNVGITTNPLRPKTPKIDGEDSDSMASTSRDCTTAGGNVSSADDNDNSLTSFEGIFNGIPESLDFDATVSSIVKENCGKKPGNLNSATSDKNTESKVLHENNETIQVSVKSLTEDLCAKQLDEKMITDEGGVKQNKSLMLADLLDKKEGPALNGVLGKDLRIGEKGLELVEKAILKETHLNNKGINVKKDSLVNVNGETRTGERSSVITHTTAMPSPQPGSKRPAENEVDQEVDDSKRLKLDSEGEEKEKKNEVVEKPTEDSKSKDEKEEVNGEEEVRASSTAANLFAALAAEALEDETDLEVPSDPQPQAVVVPGGQQIRPLYLGESSPLIVTASGTRQIIMAPGQLPQQGQVLISAGGQSLPVIVQNQRIMQSSSGQMLVASQPQQIIMSGNAQGQMLIAQPQTALVQGQPQTVLVAQATPQQPGTKTIIILQPQSQSSANSQQQKMVVSSQGAPMMVTTTVARQVVQSQTTPSFVSANPTSAAATTNATRDNLTTDVVLSSGMQNNIHQNGSQIQIISSGVQNNAPILNQNGADKSKTQINSVKPSITVKGADGAVFLCEWRGCMRSFKTANEVYMHVCSAHCPANAEVETQCLWERCDGMKRKRFSLMTHLFDRHCNADALNMMAARRKQLSTQGRTEIPAPAPPPPHPGYAPNAAFHAIKRHALEFVNPKELMKANGAKTTPPPPPPPPPSAVLLAKVASPPVQVKDDNEGPVTKSIRLTASLILRNLVIYSSVGRRFLKGYEPHLASIALSNVESSRTIAQVLADLNDTSSR